MTESPTPRRPNWLPALLLLTILAAAGIAALSGWTWFGEPSADFLIVAVVVEAGLLAWAALDKGLSRRQRTGFLGIFLAAPLIGLTFSRVGPWAALRDLVRSQSGPTPSGPPLPPPEFTYEYPKSEIIPELNTTGEHDWPAFLGNDRTGAAASPVKLAGDWKKNPPTLLWQHPVGGGVSCPVVVGDFLISHEQRGKDETIACYELKTGKQCWEHREEQFAYQGYTGPGPQATPVVANGFVVTLGSKGLLLCLDGRTGAPRWSVDLLAKHKANPPGFGITASPLIVDDLVIVGIGGEKGSLVAYDLNTGERRWTSGTAPASYSSPTIATLTGIRQVVWFNQLGLLGVEPSTGRELWSAPWRVGLGNNVCQPLFFSSTGAGSPDAVMVSVGDDGGAIAFVIERSGSGLQARELWQNKNLKLKFSSAIQIPGMAVGLDERILAAIDLKTGERRWKHGDRYGYGQIIASGDQLIVLAEDGRVVLGAPTDKQFVVRGEFQSVLKQAWNAPALAANLLALRNNQALAVYKLPTRPE